MKISAPPERRIQSLERALALLGFLADRPAGLNLTELATAAGLAPQTAQSLIRTLQAHGWVTQAGRGQPYQLGPAPLQLAARRLGRDGLVGVARDAVEALCRETGEYVLLAEWTGTTTAPLLEARSEQPLMLGSTSFDAGHLHVAATGQVLLAFLDVEDRERALAGMALKRFGPKSITRRDALAKRLAGIRKLGIAVCRDEAGEQISALAVPVRDATGRVRAALGISLPTFRLCPATERKLQTRLCHAATDISARWGWTGK
jgi:IclR family acetate operon transcriptional repressor